MEQASPIDVTAPPRADRAAIKPAPWPLARKVALALGALLLATLTTTALFTYAKFESVYSGLVQSRYRFTVFSLSRTIEDGMALGFALRQVRQVQERVEREKGADSLILAIEVFDAGGEVLFDTDRAAIGTPVPPRWLDAIRDAAPGQTFADTEDDTLVLGLPLVNSLGKLEGGIALRYPRAYLRDAAGGVVMTILRQTALALVLFGVLAVVGPALLLRRVTRPLEEMERALALVGRPGIEPPPEPVEPPADAGTADLHARFDQFLAKAHEASDHIGSALQEVERLDRLVAS